VRIHVQPVEKLAFLVSTLIPAGIRFYGSFFFLDRALGLYPHPGVGHVYKIFRIAGVGRKTGKRARGRWREVEVERDRERERR
jgi:hypothetical protein